MAFAPCFLAWVMIDGTASVKNLPTRTHARPRAEGGTLLVTDEYDANSIPVPHINSTCYLYTGSNVDSKPLYSTGGLGGWVVGGFSCTLPICDLVLLTNMHKYAVQCMHMYEQVHVHMVCHTSLETVSMMHKTGRTYFLIRRISHFVTWLDRLFPLFILII